VYGKRGFARAAFLAHDDNGFHGRPAFLAAVIAS
jgi:hypothetical protein